MFPYFKGMWQMSFESFYYTIQPADVISKSFLLDGTFIGANNVALDIIGGTAQMIYADFTTAGSNTMISWTGTTLDGTMAANDQVRVIFDRS